MDEYIADGGIDWEKWKVQYNDASSFHKATMYFWGPTQMTEVVLIKGILFVDPAAADKICQHLDSLRFV